MKQRPSLTFFARALAFSLLVSAACDDNDHPIIIMKPDIIFYGLTASNQLIQYNGNAVESPLADLTVTGLQSGETLLAIDFRPATGQLYGLGSTSRLYAINLMSGAATPVGTAPFVPAINGSVAGFDFNPTVDRIRVVTDSGQNLRLHPETGVVVSIDQALNPGTPNVSSAAYANSDAGAASTTLFDIDISAQKLFKQDPPNEGTLVEIGPLGISPTGDGGFDISPDNSVALASFTVNGANELFQVDLTTGNATSLGSFSTPVIGLAIPTNPVAYSVDGSNNLLIFNFTKSDVPVSKAITGLQMGETILGIDMRPATSQLYGLGSTSRIYTINMSNGMATAVSADSFEPALIGTNFGFDFNPTVDRIRIVSDMGQNLRVNPITGALAAMDMNLNPGNPAVSGAAYASNFAGATTTTLYDIDPMTDKLYKQVPPNEGKLEEIGGLGINIEVNNGFDIGGQTGTAYGLLTIGSSAKIYSINLTNGTVTAIADAPSGTKGLAIGLGF
jgi:hypothetical protein